MNAAFEIDTYGCRCGGQTEVMQSKVRLIGRSRVQTRRRKCKTCGATYNTAEVPLPLAQEVLGEE